MPTTPNGTVYTVTDFTPAGGHLSRYALPDGRMGDPNIPTVLYLHGSGGGYNQFSAASYWAKMRNALIDAGWAYIEGEGSGEHWGNQSGRGSYEATFTHAGGLFDIGPVVILARSMGGILGPWLYLYSTVIAPRAVGLIVNSGTQDLAYRYENGGYGVISTAYGFVDTGYETATAGHDPLLFPVADWAGKNAQWLIGTADTQVPPEPHGIALHSRVAGVLDDGELITVQGATHSAPGTYEEVAPMMGFLDRVTGVAVPPPPPAGLTIRGRTVRAIRAAGVARTLLELRPATPAATGLLIEGNFQGYTASPYFAYTGMWGHYRTDLLQAESSMRVHPDTFPDDTTFTWDVTPAPDWGGINGYLHLDYGNYDDSPTGGVVTPRQVSAITDLTVTIDWTFTGDEASGLLSECWLTPVATPTGSLDKTHEVAFFPKLSPDAATYVNGLPPVGAGSFVDSNGVTWNVCEGTSGVGAEVPYLIAYRPGHADFTGTLRYEDFLAFLTASGALTGAEWFNGVAFGVEPHSGAGSLTIKDFAVTYA